METDQLIERLIAAHPGWSLWDDLVALVRSLPFEHVEDEYLGDAFTSGQRLSFAVPDPDQEWPEWMPAYVPALFGMKAESWEAAGGFGDMFTGAPARRGRLFSAIANDDRLGYPVFDPPAETYDFQSAESGATFFISRDLQILYPSASRLRMEALDTVESFAQQNIAQALAGEPWTVAYQSGELT